MREREDDVAARLPRAVSFSRLLCSTKYYCIFAVIYANLIFAGHQNDHMVVFVLIIRCDKVDTTFAHTTEKVPQQYHPNYIGF